MNLEGIMNEKLSRRKLIRSAAAATTMITMPQIAFGKRTDVRKPNIVFILIDDLGWADVGCFGSRFYETPNIDNLAAEGMMFTGGYAACPVCSPTRASIMTGKYPARLHLTDYLVGRRTRKDSPVLPAPYRHELPLEEVTLAEELKRAGYVTCHTGKWHLGGKPFYPEHQGFDVNIAGCHSGMPRSFFWPQWGDNPPIEGKFDGEYLPDRLSQEACTFIQQNKDRPFFLYLAHYAVHIPIEGKKEKIAKYKEKLKKNPSEEGEQNNPYYAAMVESVDESVGRVLETIHRLEIDDRTVVVFFSDNGGLSVREGKNTPATSNAPLRAGKGYLYEGGIRESLIVKWPGAAKSGSKCGVPVSSVDFFPTLLEIAGLKDVKTNGAIDGESIVPLLKKSGGLKRDAIFWHYPHFSNQGGRPGGAVRQGEYKLIERYEDGRLELYNLKKDIGEKNNLALTMPNKAESLRKVLNDWRKSVDAAMPPPNPDYKKTEN